MAHARGPRTKQCFYVLYCWYRARVKGLHRRLWSLLTHLRGGCQERLHHLGLLNEGVRMRH
eukprot:8867494-Pyramimonas_sp.AAC.2